MLNAIDAMPEGGTLTVRTAALTGGVRLEISDTGQGLTPEECERLFTPYYTTKTARHGTGPGDRAVGGERSRRADFGGEREGQGRDVPHRTVANCAETGCGENYGTPADC